jgi:hypothetical protein
MTEQESLACDDPEPMLTLLERRGSDRRLQLFAVACCRRAWNLMTEPRHRHAVEAAERFADGLLTEAQFQAVLQPIVAEWAELPDLAQRAGGWGPFHFMIGATRHLGTGGGARYAASYAARGLACLAGSKDSPGSVAARLAEEAAQCALLRDLFGDPSMPFRFDPDWLSGEGRAAAAWAREIYRGGRFESLSSLADALQQVGCRDQAVLDHCKQSGPHARGCWVVDALLGKETAVRTGLVTEADWQTCPDPEPLLHFLRDKGSARKWRLFAVACCRRIGHLMADERSRQAVEVAARYADGAATEQELDAARRAAQQAQQEAKVVEWVAETEANFRLTPAYAAACCRLYAASAAYRVVCRHPRVTDALPITSEDRRWRPTHRCAAEAVSLNVVANFGSRPEDARSEEARRAAESARAAEQRAHGVLLRDLFGHYLGPPGDEGAWLPTVLAMGVIPAKTVEQWCLLPRPRGLTLRPEWLAANDGAVRRISGGIYDDQTFDRMPLLAEALLNAGCDNEVLLAHCRSGELHARGCWVVDLLLARS